MTKRVMLSLALAAGCAGTVLGQQGSLFIGQEGGDQVTKTVSLSGFPNVFYADGSEFFVQGAAGTPEGLIYACDGYFTNDLYGMLPGQAPSYLARLSVSGIYGLGYVNGKLYGYSNFGSPMGIYEIDPATGSCTLRMSTDSSQLRFFALDGNPADGKLYGFSEYGQSGLYRIDPETWTVHRIAATPPGSYGMCRGMAVGNNTCYMVDTHPSDTYYAYDLTQGDNGVYVPFENPYPESRNGGGAWYDPSVVPPPPNNDTCDGAIDIAEGVHAFSTLTALTDGYSGCGGYNDVWFRYTATTTHYAIIGTCDHAAFDTIVTIYDGCGGNEIDCNDDNCGVQSSIAMMVEAGRSYIIRVAGWGPDDRGGGSLVIGECQGATITGQPESQTVCGSSDPNAYVIFRTYAEGTGTLTYQWERDGVPLNNGPTGTGSQIYGSNNWALIMLTPGVADAGDYRCVVTNQCEQTVTVTSNPAHLNVCPADFNCDGFLDFFDYDDYVNCFETAQCPGGRTADFNGDGFADFFDYDAYVAAFEVGC